MENKIYNIYDKNHNKIGQIEAASPEDAYYSACLKKTQTYYVCID